MRIRSSIVGLFLLVFANTAHAQFWSAMVGGAIGASAGSRPSSSALMLGSTILYQMPDPQLRVKDPLLVRIASVRLVMSDNGGGVCRASQGGGNTLREILACVQGNIATFEVIQVIQMVDPNIHDRATFWFVYTAKTNLNPSAVPVNPKK